MKTTKVVEITIRTVITYDNDKYSLRSAARQIAAKAVDEDIYDAKELYGNHDFDDNYTPWEVE